MGGGGGSPPPSSSNDRGNSNNEPKCEKCKVNEAVHTGITLTIGEEKITLYNGHICDPCAKELMKCQICKAEEIEHRIKDGSDNVLLCGKCYYCSKCKTNQAIAKGVVDNFKDDNDRGQVLYEGAICEACIKMLIKENKEKNQKSKCKVCNQEIDPNSLPMMMPDWAFEKPDEEKTVQGHKVGGKPIMC